MYCNRASMDQDVPDLASPKVPQNTCKRVQFPDAPERARTYLLAFARRRSGVRIPSAPLQIQKVCRNNGEVSTSTWVSLRSLYTNGTPTNTTFARMTDDPDQMTLYTLESRLLHQFTP